MHLYIAGLYTSHFHHGSNLYRKIPANARLLRDNVQHYLESYHYVNKGRYVDNMRRNNERIFLDSGAFSSFSLGVEVDIDAYAEFVKDHQDIIEMASVLDAIGDPEGTYHNQMHLEKRGAEVLPCFHFGEPFDLCDFYVNNYDYITIGGMVPIPNKKLAPWLDELWSKHLTDSDGRAKLKVHGFGLTARDLMLKYPWFSCDSSSWIQAASNGAIILPEYDRAIHISARSPNIRNFGQHYESMPPESKTAIEERLHHYGLTVEEVMHTHGPRWALNCFTYDMLGRMLGDDHWHKPFKPAHVSLF